MLFFNDVHSFKAGFVDQKPYRTCASRFCTPSGISLDSDIRIETCCHSNLCNDIPRRNLDEFFHVSFFLFSLVSWSAWSKWYSRSSTRRPDTSPADLARFGPDQWTTQRRRPATSRMYVVNEIANGDQKSSSKESSEEDNNVVKPKLKFNASNPATFGINWKRVPFEKDFGNPAASISKLLILIMPILIVLLF